ncbi:hypothetical protein EVC24_049 [Rhizobium phage RHph_I4]|nr:hypothetical protein EVC24_049 [Rhizobium phage RHph_I4]
MPFLLIDKQGHLLGLMTYNVTHGRTVVVAKQSKARLVASDEVPSILSTYDRQTFELNFAADFYDYHFCLLKEDGGAALQSRYIEDFRSFIPNLFYADDRARDKPRYTMPVIEPSTALTGHEVNLCEFVEGVGYVPRREVTREEWWKDEGVQRWKNFCITQEQRNDQEKLLENQRREHAEQARKKREAAERAEKLEKVKRAKNALRVVRKVHLE